MKNKRFEITYKDGNSFSTVTMVLVDKETGINYLFVNSGYGGGLIPLLDENGKSVVTK